MPRPAVRVSARPAALRAASLASLAALLVAAPLGAQTLAGPRPTGPVPPPVVLDHERRFIDRFASVGDDLFIAGQPTEAALRQLRAEGVTTIVNLRMPEEMRRVPFDEAALAASLGMTYVHLPVRGGSGPNAYSPETVRRFAEAMEGARGKVLLHCTVAWRASHLWAAYLIERRGVPADTALAHARRINLMDDMRHDDGVQPVEAFLGRPVPELRRPRRD